MNLYRPRWIVALAIVLGLGAMLRYPGGTPRDHATTGYSITQNFLSDLGMTVAYDGQRNVFGATLFILSLLLLVLGLGACLLGVVRLYARTPRSRGVTRVVVIVGAVACLAFVGVAMTPENAAMAVHVAFTIWAWRIVACVAVLLWAAATSSNLLPFRVTVLSGFIAALTVVYASLLTFGPTTATTTGLEVQVGAQKAIAVLVVAFLLYLDVEAERVTPRGAAAPEGTRRS